VKHWKSELDALIKDTMAFAAAAQVTVSASRVAVVPSMSLSEQPSAKTIAAIPPPLHDTLPTTWASPEREEIRTRVASFKAHQERWIREREEYANSILRSIVR
jgi:hypothetical protein